MKKKKIINAFLGACVLGTALSYLIQTNAIATKGYEIKELEQKLQSLQKVKKELESKSLELQSMTLIASKVEKLNLVKISKAKYLTPDERTALRP